MRVVNIGGQENEYKPVKQYAILRTSTMYYSYSLKKSSKKTGNQQPSLHI